MALNLYKIRDAKDAGGEFFRRVQKQRPDQYQGIYIVSPAGKVLSSQGKEPEKPKSWVEGLLDAIDDALESAGTPEQPRKVKVVDPLANRGLGVRADGGVDLAVYSRLMLRGLERNGLGDTTIDTIKLSPKEWSAFAPPRAERGAGWDLPEEVGGRLHAVLSPSSDQSTLARADEVTEVKLRGTVTKVAGGIAYVKFTGRIAGAHRYRFDPHKGKLIHAEVALTGVGAWDCKTRKILSLTLVGDGVYRHFPPYAHDQKYGAVVEWRRQR